MANKNCITLILEVISRFGPTYKASDKAQENATIDDLVPLTIEKMGKSNGHPLKT